MTSSVVEPRAWTDSVIRFAEWLDRFLSRPVGMLIIGIIAILLFVLVLRNWPRKG